MATDDILSSVFHLEGPASAASFKVFWQQTVDNDTPGTAVTHLAEGLRDAFNIPLRNVLSNQWHFTGITVYKHEGDPDPGITITASTGPGTTIGTNDDPALPANNALVIGLGQSSFSGRHNGRVFIPGIPEPQVDGGIVKQAFSDTQVLALANVIAGPIQDSPDAGVYFAGVINQTVLNLAPPAKDWAGAFAFLTSFTRNPRLSPMAKRKTKVVGAVSAS